MKLKLIVVVLQEMNKIKNLQKGKWTDEFHGDIPYIYTYS